MNYDFGKTVVVLTTEYFYRTS